MPIRTDHYTDEELPAGHEQALLIAIDLLVDEFFCASTIRRSGANKVWVATAYPNGGLA